MTLLDQQPMIPLQVCLAEHVPMWMGSIESLVQRAKRMPYVTVKPAAAQREPKAGRPMETPQWKIGELPRAELAAVLIEPSEFVVRGAIPVLGPIQGLIGASSMLAQSYER